MDQMIEKSLRAVTGTLCHLQELVDLAYQLTCELHPANTQEHIIRTGGRLSTLMHVASQQVLLAMSEAHALMPPRSPREEANELPPPPTAPLQQGTARTGTSRSAA